MENNLDAEGYIDDTVIDMYGSNDTESLQRLKEPLPKQPVWYNNNGFRGGHTIKCGKPVRIAFNSEEKKQ